MKEIVICSAIKTATGLVIRGHRHNHILLVMAHEGISRIDSVQGFVTSKNRFVDREEAYRIQHPKMRVLTGKNPKLYSEDLY